MLAVSQLNGLELVGQALKISVAAGQGGGKMTTIETNARNGNNFIFFAEVRFPGGQMDDTATYAKMDDCEKSRFDA